MKRFTLFLLFSLSLLLVVGSNDFNRLYGDVNGDKKTNIDDVTDLINYLLTGHEAGPVAVHALGVHSHFIGKNGLQVKVKYSN